jgi:hypothetical protein
VGFSARFFLPAGGWLATMTWPTLRFAETIARLGATVSTLETAAGLSSLLTRRQEALIVVGMQSSVGVVVSGRSVDWAFLEMLAAKCPRSPVSWFAIETWMEIVKENV